MANPVLSRSFAAAPIDHSSSGDNPVQPPLSNQKRLTDDDDVASDPFLESLLEPLTTPPDETDDDTANPFSDGFALREPKDLDVSEEDLSPIDVPIALTDDDARSPHANRDDEQGPAVDEALEFPESEAETFLDGSEEGPIETPFDVASQGDAFDASSYDSDQEEAGSDADGLYIDDAELPWAKERWAEQSLGPAFSATRHLALVGSTLCVAGDTPCLLDARRACLLEELRLGTKAIRILSRDPEAKDLIVLTSQGELLSQSRIRECAARSVLQTKAEGMVNAIWQLAPGSPVVLAQLENGQLYDVLETECVAHKPVSKDNTLPRPIALSELGEPRVSLLHGKAELELLVEAGEDQRRLHLTAPMKRAAAEGRPLLIGFNDWILFGVRDCGLWAYKMGDPEFSPVPGCRSLTAATVGRTGGRSTAFIGLFSELEDRAEIAMVDLATGRASRIAELRINSDSKGPEDDPLELARIDSLVWDQNTGRLWVAGGFGVTCFCQPQNAATAR